MRPTLNPDRVVASLSVKRTRTAYPEGPKREMTPKWKRAIALALDVNRRSDTRPRTMAELAEMVDADKSTIGHMLTIELKAGSKRKLQTSSKLVDRISSVMGVPLPFQLGPDDDERKPEAPAPAAPAQRSELDEVLARVRELPVSDQDKIADLIRVALRMRR